MAIQMGTIVITAERRVSVAIVGTKSGRYSSQACPVSRKSAREIVCLGSDRCSSFDADTGNPSSAVNGADADEAALRAAPAQLFPGLCTAAGSSWSRGGTEIARSYLVSFPRSHTLDAAGLVTHRCHGKHGTTSSRSLKKLRCTAYGEHGVLSAQRQGRGTPSLQSGREEAKRCFLPTQP